MSLSRYVQGNMDYAIEFAEKNLKGIRILKSEGTYLVWIDLRETGLGTKEINRFVLEKAGIAMDIGEWFGPGRRRIFANEFSMPKRNRCYGDVETAESRAK